MKRKRRHMTIFYCTTSFGSFTSSPDKYNLPVCIEQRHISVKQLTVAIEFLINMSKHAIVKSIRQAVSKIGCFKRTNMSASYV